MPIAESSPRSLARIAGVLYLLTIVTGIFAELFVRGKLIVPGDAATTAANVLGHEQLFRWGLAAEIVATACYVAVTALFHRLFRAVNGGVSLVAAFLSLVGCAVGGVNCVFQAAPLAVLGGAPYLKVFSVEQLQSLALLLLKLRGQMANIAIIFFGFYCVLIGYLIIRSTFLPRILGVLMAIAGLGWLTFLAPPVANFLAPLNMASGLLGEGSLTAWLVAAGVNAQRWREQARGLHGGAASE